MSTLTEQQQQDLEKKVPRAKFIVYILIKISKT